MEKLLTKVIESWIIYGENNKEIFASNILESSLWEAIVYGVCKWIKVIAEKEWKSIEEVVEDIIEEKEESDLFI